MPEVARNNAGGKVEVRVFLVEDLKSTQGLYADLFAALGGFRIVATVRTEAEANLWLEENPNGWDLAVIDLVLEQGTGMGVVARAKANPAAGRVVVLSSYATPGVRKHCLHLGADAVFDKGEASEFIRYCAEHAQRENSGP
jgi:CheY-like chemotaxis protein